MSTFGVWPLAPPGVCIYIFFIQGGFGIHEHFRTAGSSKLNLRSTLNAKSAKLLQNPQEPNTPKTPRGRIVALISTLVLYSSPESDRYAATLTATPMVATVDDIDAALPTIRNIR